MAGTQWREWTWRFEAPPQAVWRVLADTARFNEAAGLPKQQIRETPQPDGSVLYEATARQGPFRLAWRELPVNWATAPGSSTAGSSRARPWPGSAPACA